MDTRGCLVPSLACYAVVSTAVEWDIEMPMFELGADGKPTGVIDDVRQTEREAILVRTDLPPGQLRVSHRRAVTSRICSNIRRLDIR